MTAPARTSPAAPPARLPTSERGTATLTDIGAVAVSMVVFVATANVIVVLYGRGVIRGALDEAVRAASRAGATDAACQRRADEILSQLLAGPMGEDVTVRCAHTDGRVTATAQASFRGWLPGIPTLTFDLGATAVKEAQGDTA